MIIKEGKLYAGEGMLLTNGASFAKVVYLADGANASKWREVLESERTDEGGDTF